MQFGLVTSAIQKVPKLFAVFSWNVTIDCSKLSGNLQTVEWNIDADDKKNVDWCQITVVGYRLS